MFDDDEDNNDKKQKPSEEERIYETGDYKDKGDDLAVPGDSDSSLKDPFDGN